MKKLDDNWLTAGWVDFEYKKYLMLAYLQEVKGAFQKMELYPSLGDLVRHFNNLQKIRGNKDFIQENFPDKLDGIDARNLRLQYKKMVEDDEVMAAIEEIIAFAYPKLKEALDEGKEIYEFVEDNCELSPIGVMPLYANEGYFFVSMDRDDTVYIHQYQITIFEHINEKMRGIHSTLVNKVTRGVGETFESIKKGLIATRKTLPNPATFLLYSKLSVPGEPTLVPVARRMLVRYVTHNS
ncbi:hypothetical protein [Fulvivirga sedimenti]|uniref:Uncharacterized protein n=1 Tax=Fulvivirga sedimenti TaxID=2879465 RepID=A0A9X1KV32_9BACT|nr:hypothetical protein [Fulvivirga sedimenti]MCA6073355.1 hypothetical protein [Fulvivirga sedimenti]